MKLYNIGPALKDNFTQNEPNDKKMRKIIGNIGEDAACNFLRKDKYFILKRNFRIRTAEIDIIAYKAQTIHFFEVKTRKNTYCGHPDESVNALKIHKITSAAQHFLNSNPNLADFNIYFGLISIKITNNEFEINIIPFF